MSKKGMTANTVRADIVYFKLKMQHALKNGLSIFTFGDRVIRVHEAPVILKNAEDKRDGPDRGRMMKL